MQLRLYEPCSHHAHGASLVKICKHEHKTRFLMSEIRLRCVFVQFPKSSAITILMGWHGEPPSFYPSAYHTARDRMAISEVAINEVYVSNFKGAADKDALRAMGVTHIASVGEEFVGNGEGDGFWYWNHDITDDDHQGEAMAGALHDAASFINDGIAKGGKVLVHCAAGISRSATVVLGWLIIHRNLTLLEAFGQLFNARPCIWPNDGFMTALRALEVEVRGGSPTISAEDYERWGDYDGPEVEGGDESGKEGGDEDGRGGSDASAPPGFMPRLVRDETCLEAEEKELAALDEESERRRKLMEAINASAAAEGESEVDPSSPPRRKPRRISLSKADRADAAKQATRDARESLRVQSTSSSSWSRSSSWNRSSSWSRRSMASVGGGGLFAGAIRSVILMLRGRRALGSSSRANGHEELTQAAGIAEESHDGQAGGGAAGESSKEGKKKGKPKRKKKKVAPE